jgi:predicted DNA-binding transcriptional regulator AlpA
MNQKENFCWVSAFNEKGAADYLGLSVKTLQAWRFQSRGPKYIKLGRAVRYRQVDLDAFVNDHTINPAA